MKQPVGSSSNVPTLPTSVVFSDEIIKVIGALLSEEDVEFVCKNAVSNALAGNVSSDFPTLYEFKLPDRNVRVLYQFRNDFTRLYMIAAIRVAPKKVQVAGTKVPLTDEVNAQVRQLRKAGVGVSPRDFLQWLVKRFFRRHDD